MAYQVHLEMDGLLVVEAVDMVLAPVQVLDRVDMVVAVLVAQQEQIMLETTRPVTDLVEVVVQELVPLMMEELDPLESLWFVIRHHKQRINKVPYEFI